MCSEGLNSPVQSSYSWSSVPLGHLSHRLSKAPIALTGISMGFGLFGLENFLLVPVWVLGLLKSWSFIWDVQTFWMASLYLYSDPHIYKRTEVCGGNLSWPAQRVCNLLTQGRHSYAEVKAAFWWILCHRGLIQKGSSRRFCHLIPISTTQFSLDKWAPTGRCGLTPLAEWSECTVRLLVLLSC